jgi:3-oxoacyl-[acyl-carrier-protein] synthase-3
MSDTAPGTSIVALGHYQPERVVTNKDLEEIVDTSDAWIRSRVGIEERRFAGPDETVDSMAVEAARNALANSGPDPAEIDLIVLATCTAVNRSPNMSARVAAKLGLEGPAGSDGPALLDLNVACAGFSHALAVADHTIRAGSARNALVIGAEKLTEFTDWSDRSTCVLTADGAGAAVVTPSRGADAGIGPVLWGSVPSMSNAVRIEPTANRPLGAFAQEGQSVYRWATTKLPEITRRVCERGGVRPEELAAVIFHQANLRIIEPLARSLGAVNAVVAKDIVESGNTSAASIPLAFSKMVQRGEIPSGAPVLLFGFGGNLSYAGQVVRCP